MDKEWRRTVKNYIYHFDLNHKTKYDDLFAFLIPHLNKNNELEIQKESILVNKFNNNVSIDSGNNSLDSNSNIDILSDQSESSSSDSDEESSPDEDSSDSNNDKEKKNEVETNSSLDIYCQAIRKAFTEQLTDEQQFEAMLHICQKIKNFSILHKK